MATNEIITSQYRASLEMLSGAITTCTDALWLDPEYKNPFWHIAYHTLFYTHLYVQRSGKEFLPWSKHIDPFHTLDPHPHDPQKEPNTAKPYTKEDILEYLDVCLNEVEKNMSTVDLEAESGFHWLPFSKLELQIYNIRHIQHHTGQLIDRLRTKESFGITWVGSNSTKQV